MYVPFVCKLLLDDVPPVLVPADVMISVICTRCSVRVPLSHACFYDKMSLNGDRTMIMGHPLREQGATSK